VRKLKVYLLKRKRNKAHKKILDAQLLIASLRSEVDWAYIKRCDDIVVGCVDLAKDIDGIKIWRHKY